MNEFDETPSFYVWPTDHIDGNPYPEDFYRRLYTALHDAGFDCEPV